MAKTMFTADALQFLADLKENNDRDWFQPRKSEFETLLREPMLGVVKSLNSALAESAPDYITDPPKAVHRIYRDTRFSKNKAPYKSHVSAFLWDRRLGKDGGAGIYIHVSPEEFMLAGGLYQTEPAILLAVRELIAQDHERLRKLLRTPSLRNSLGDLKGDKLVRPPRGFAADHAAIDLLMHKDLVLERTLPAAEATNANALRGLTKRVLALIPFVQFLNEPLIGRSQTISSLPR